MFAPELDVAWLERSWETCCDAGHLPDADHCYRLVRGYVGCNLIIELVEECWRIANGGEQSFAGLLNCARLDSSLQQPPMPEAEDLLAGQAALEELEVLAHPWLQVHRWVLREALIRFLLSRNDRTLAYHHALRAFRTAVPTPVVTPQAFPGRGLEVCIQRNLAAVSAFDAWWDDVVGRLTTYLGQTTWQALRLLTVDQLTAGLSTALCPQPCSVVRPGPRTRLLQAMSQQWRLCALQRNWVLRDCPHSPWFNDLTGQLLHALFTNLARQLLSPSAPLMPVWLNVIDLQHYWSTITWLGQLAPQVHAGLTLPRPEDVDPESLVRLEPADIDLLLSSFGEIAQLLSPTEHNRPYAGDLFADPQPPPFGVWVAGSGTYWP